MSTIELQSNNHSMFSMNYHLVLVIRDGREIIDNAISVRLREIFENIAPNYNISAVEWYYGSDYIHVVFTAEPNSELSKFINAYKSASSRLIKKEFPAIREKLWNGYFWSRSFCLLSTGEAPSDIIQQYIESQGGKHYKQMP